MKGTIKWQVTEIFKEIKEIGNSKYSAKNEARLAGATGSHGIAEKTGIYSYRTNDAYRISVAGFGTWAKENLKLKDLTKTTGTAVKAYLDSRINDGIAHKTFELDKAALNKFETALNKYSQNHNLNRTYDFKLNENFNREIHKSLKHTDETAFTSTNSAYISAGESSAPAAAPIAGAVSPIHSFYSATNTKGAGVYNIDLGPYSCTGGVLTAEGGYNTYTLGVAKLTGGPTTPAMGGFGDIGFFPVGRLYFYYGVAINSTASLSGPTAQQGAGFPLTYKATSVAGGAPVGTSNVNSSCGGGFEAFAGSNFTGGNYQLYAVDDFTRTATLISGAAF